MNLAPLPPWVLAAPVALPLAAALAVQLLPRGRAPLALATGAATLAACLALLVAVVQQGPLQMALGGWPAPLGIRWRADLIAVLFLLSSATVSLAVAGFAAALWSRREAALARRWWAPLLFLWAALNALFLSGDAFNLYVTLELLTLGAVMLVSLEGDGPALAGAMRYLLVALAGSTAYLLGVALLYHGTGSLDLAQAAAAGIPPLALALMTTGLMAKGALFPLHGWLPPAHAAAPAPASALLSGLVVKGAFYILLRLWLETGPQPAAALQLLGACGAAAVLWGSLLALNAPRLKLVVAWSTVAQLGYLLLLFPLAQGPWSAIAVAGGVWLALAHGLAKAAMFLAAGLVLHAWGHDHIGRLSGLARHAPMTTFTLGLAGLTLMALPPSGGFTAKWLLLEAAMGGGQWWWALVLLGGGLLAAAYLFRVLAAAFGPIPEHARRRPVPRVPDWIALLLALAALLLGLAGDRPLGWLGAGPP